MSKLKQKINYTMIIYAIKNLINDKIYIGQTARSFSSRKAAHIYKLRNNKHENSYLQNSFNKYGENNFIFLKLKNASNRNELNVLEVRLIKKFKSMNKKYGYNLKSGGYHVIYSDESKKKMSISASNRPPISDETREKLSILRKGKKRKKTQVLKWSGENSGSSILKNEDVLEIRRLYENGYKVSQISKKFGRGWTTIDCIIKRKNWKHI